MRSWKVMIIAASTLWLTLQTAQAGIVVGATRVIYKGGARESSLNLNNPDKAPYLIQSWIEKSQQGEHVKAPFLMTPPLFRLDAGQENVLRIVRTGEQLPENQESVFWINVISIPANEKTDENLLQITVKTQIKLFYRPAALTAEMAEQAYKMLELRRVGNKIQAHNPTPFYISFYELKVGDQTVSEAKMIAPYSTQQWALPNTHAMGSVSWQAITDYGGITPIVSSAF